MWNSAQDSAPNNHAVLAQKLFNRASWNYSAPLGFFHQTIHAQSQPFQMFASVHHRFNRREDPNAENILEKCVCAPIPDCNVIVNAEESETCVYVLANVMRWATLID